MIISAQQLRVFEAHVRKPFEERLFVCAKDVAPVFLASSGEPAMRDFVRLCLKRACNLGLTNEDYIEMFITTSLDLGIGFDIDPQYPWAKAIMHGVPRDTEYIVARDLYRATETFRENVHGEENAFTRAAFQRVLHLPCAVWTTSHTPEETLRLLSVLHPERYSFAGEEALRGMLEIVDRHAQLCADVQPDRHRLVRASILFLLGQAALFIPTRTGLLSSSASTVKDPPAQDSNSRLENFLLYAMQLAAHPSARR